MDMSCIEKMYNCQFCSKSFFSVGSRNDHERNVHKEIKNHKCEQCGKKFYKKFNFQVHKQNHSSDYLYKCHICNKKFKSDFNLKVHMKCHVDKKNYMCEICGKVFKTLSILQAHSNFHTKETKYNCTLCDKTYSYRASLYLHMRSHSGNRPYHCKYCSATFMVKSHLIDHLKIHTNERPFKCMYCQASFARAVILKKHIKSHMRAGIEVNLEKALLHAKLQIKENKTSVLVDKQSQTNTNDHTLAIDKSNEFETSKKNLILHSKALADDDEHVTVILSSKEGKEGFDKTSHIVGDNDALQNTLTSDDSCNELYISEVIRSKNNLCLTKLMSVLETDDGPHFSEEGSLSKSEDNDPSRDRDLSVCDLFLHKTKERLDLSSSAILDGCLKSEISYNGIHRYNNSETTCSLNAEKLSQSHITEDESANILNDSEVKEYSVGFNDNDTYKRKKLKKCQYCNAKYKYEASLRAHEEKHRKEVLLDDRHKEQYETVCKDTVAGGERMKINSVSCVQSNHSFRCEFCKVDFSYRSELRKHAKLHSSKYKHLCKICNQAFNQEIYLTRHNCLSQGSKPNLGMKNPKTVLKSHDFHSVFNSSAQKYSYNAEPKLFTLNNQDAALSNSLRHIEKIENSTEGITAVRECSYETEYEKRVTRENISGSITKEDINSCVNDDSNLRGYGDRVKNTFASSDESFLPHIDTYEIEVTISTDSQVLKKTEISCSKSQRFSKYSQLLKCKYCPMQCRFNSILKIHERSHTGEKPFSCPVCKKTFSKKCNMELHKRIHTGEQSYLCDYCGKYFSYKYSLNAHKRLHTKELPFICIVCGKGFRFESSRSVHLKRHMGNKAFKCDYCSKAFVSKVEMEDHSRTHTGEKPYSCEHCSQNFSHRHHLVDHRRIHTGVKPYKCQVCNMSFRTLGMLKRHNRQHNDHVDE